MLEAWRFNMGAQVLPCRSINTNSSKNRLRIACVHMHDVNKISREMQHTDSSISTQFLCDGLRQACVFLSATALCLGFTSYKLALADTEVPQKPSAPKTMSLPDLLKKLAAEKKSDAPTPRTKVPSRVLRAKIQENKLKAVLAKIEEEPDNVVAYKALLQLRMENGEVREAIEVLDKLITMEPERIELKYMRARAYHLVGDVNKSRSEFHKLVELQPFSAKALQGLAITMRKDGEDEHVILETIRNAIKNASDQNMPLASRNLKMLLGQILTIQNKLAEALVQYDELIEEDPNDFRPYLCKCLLHDSLGNKEEANKCYRKYRELCPKSFPKRRYLDDLLMKGSLNASLKEEMKKNGNIPFNIQQPESPSLSENLVSNEGP